MADGFEFTLENESEFLANLSRLQKLTADLRIPLRLIASDFYRSQKIIFQLKSPGLYPPLGGFNPNRIVEGTQTARVRAETLKERKVGFAYPLLVGQTRSIEKSTTTRSHSNSIFRLTKNSLTIGTNVPYGKFHQSDRLPRTKLPKRKFIFIDGGPNDASKSSRISGRRERWTKIIDTHVSQIITGSI